MQFSDIRDGMLFVRQQKTRCCPGAPDRPVEHPMIVHEAPLLREPADLQQAGHRTFAGCQDSPDQQHLRVLPAALEKQRRKAQDHRGEAGWQVKHGGVSWRGHASLASHPPRRLRLPQMAKVELMLEKYFKGAEHRASLAVGCIESEMHSSVTRL